MTSREKRDVEAMVKLFHAMFDTGASYMCSERLGFRTLEPVMKDRASG